MYPSENLFAGTWAIWAAIWILAAFRTSRTVSAQPLRSRALHLGLIGLGATLVFLHFRSPQLFSWHLIPNRGAIAWTGLGLTVIGIGFAIDARAHLGRLWSGTVTLKERHTLVQSGPYTVTRHPIYTGLLVAFLGTAVANGTVAASLGFGLVFLVCWLKIGLEERLLRAEFGQEYAEYCERIPRLIPFFW